MRAIEVSQIAIVVFSKTYTESTWCLDELQKIIESHETYGQIVVPVFYYVDPSDVRHQKGDFGKALKAAEVKRFSGEHLEYVLCGWRHALTEAAKCSGWDVRNYRNEAELVKEIVEDVLRKLDNTLLSIPEFPVGLESHVKQVIGYIENKSCRVSVIGIWGMGGLGKTTVAKAIYNLIHRTFKYKSFMENIREVCQKDVIGYVHLQRRLLSDVLKTKVKIHSIGMGICMIYKSLARKGVLIVLDDVDDFAKLDYLCGQCTWFGPGSRIIITTRDVHILYKFRVDCVYQLMEMDTNESLRLFSWHGFREANPGEEFIKLARNAVAYCGGLPLALEVLGSCLIERTIDEWISLLYKLKRIPNTQVQKILRISFDDGLCDQMEKDIFLYVRCFFIGKDRAYVTKILNGCDLHADIGM